MNTIEQLQEKKQQTLKKVFTLQELLQNIKSNTKINFLKELYEDNQVFEEIQGLITLLESDKITISVVAEVSQGKSTFLNALIFRDTVLDSGRGAVTARLFKIEYDKNYSITINNETKTLPSLEALKQSVKSLNQEAREEIEKDKKLYENSDDVIITLPNEMLKKGITVYDTPGFGSLDEELIYKLISKAVSQSDATILLIDISKGIKKNEMSFIKDVMKSISPEKRYIVFNRFDEVISEDQKIIMEEEELQKEIENVEKTTKKELAELAEVDENEINTYMLSSLKALAGFKTNDLSKIKESRFDIFEKDFWSKVIAFKDTIYNERIQKANSLIKHTHNNFINVKEDLNSNLNEIEKLLIDINQVNKEFSNIYTNAVNTFNNSLKEAKVKQKRAYDTTDLYNEMEKILCGKIYESINTIGVIEKSKVWSLKNTYIKKIKEAVDDSLLLIKPGVEEYISHIEKTILDIQNDINLTIKEINTKLESFEKYNIEPLEEIKFVINTDGHIEFDLPDDLQNRVSIDKEVFAVIAGIVAEVVATNLLRTTGVGIAIAAVITTALQAYKKVTDPNKKLAKEVAEKIMEDFKKSFDKKFSGINEFGEVFSDIINEKIGSYKAKLESIAKILEDPKEKEIELNRLKKEIEEINSYINHIESLC